MRRTAQRGPTKGFSSTYLPRKGPLNFERASVFTEALFVASKGFEPLKSETSDLQSDPFGRLGNLPGRFRPVYSPSERA